MLRITLHILVVITMYVLAFSSAQAERRVALVIGNSTYEHVSKLPNPAQDAQDVADALKRLSFEVVLEIDQPFRKMRRSLRNFARKAARADMAVVYFAGHGIEIDGQNYLIPTDAELREDVDVEFETLSLDQVMRSVRGARELKLVLLDACRNNPFAHSMRMSGNTRSVGRGLARIEPTVGTLVSYAAKQGTTADDGAGRNSPYTQALLKYLEEPGLEVNFLFRKVRDEVLKSTNRAQEPFTYGSLPGKRIFLREGTEEDQTASDSGSIQNTAIELAYWNAIKDSEDPVVIQSYIDKYPEGQFTFLAKVMLKRIRNAEAEKAKAAQEAAAANAARQAQAEAEEKAAKEAERRAAAEAAEDAKRRKRLKDALAQAKAAEERAKRQAEARRKAEEIAKGLAAQKAEDEAKRRARLEAALASAQEAERRAKALAKARAEAAAKQEAALQAREEAERKAKEEVRKRAELEAALAAARESERLAKQEAETRVKEARKRAQDRVRRIAAEQKAREDAERKAAAAAEEEVKRRAKLEAALAAARKAEKKAQQLAELQAAEQAKRKADRESEEAARRQRVRELKDWEAVQASTDLRQIRAFLEKHPSGLFADIARARLSAVKGLAIASLQQQSGHLHAQPEVPPVPQLETEALNGRELVLAVQRQLQRHGCKPGRPDGDWGRRSRAALQRFVRHTGIRFASLSPSQDTLNALDKRRLRGCPLICGPRESATNGRCVLKKCPSGETLTRAGRCVAKNRLEKKKRARLPESKKDQKRRGQSKKQRQKPASTQKRARGKTLRQRCPSWCYYSARSQFCLDRKSNRWCRNKQNRVID